MQLKFIFYIIRYFQTDAVSSDAWSYECSVKQLISLIYVRLSHTQFLLSYKDYRTRDVILCSNLSVNTQLLFANIFALELLLMNTAIFENAINTCYWIMLLKIYVIYILINTWKSAHVISQEYIILYFWDVFNKYKGKIWNHFILTSDSLINDTIMHY